MGLEFKIETKFDNEKVAREVVQDGKNVLYEMMLAIERHAKRLAPVDTGRLRNSIHVEPSLPSDEMAVTTGVSYAVYQEYGTYRMKAQPFMRPAKRIALKTDFPKIAKKYDGSFKAKG